MLIDLTAWRKAAKIGEAASNAVFSAFAVLPGGGGRFAFGDVTVGVLLNPLASHRAAYASDKERPTPLAAGEGWILPAGADGACQWTGENAFLNVRLAARLFEEGGTNPGAVGQAAAGALDPLTVSLALQIHAAADQPGGALYRDALAAALAAHIARPAAFAAAAPALEDARLKRAKDLIEANLAQPVSLEDMAAAAGMSPFHFARAFKQATGQAPHAFLVVQRLERAKVLLRTTGLPIAEIAVRVGWENPSKFAAQFKKHVGVTPGAWKAG